MHREVTPISPRRFNPAIPEALDQIIMKVLSKEPSSRYRSADQLGRILVNFSHQADAYLANIPPMAPLTNHAVQAPPAGPTTPNLPATNASLPRPAAPPHFIPSSPQLVQEEPRSETDWGTIALGLLTALVVGGLVPWWLFVYFSINPPH